MPTDRYWGEDATLTVAHEDGTAVVVGMARNVSIRAAAEHVELYTPESILRQDVKRREVAIIVEMEFVEFDEDFAQMWLAGSSTGTTTITDDSDVALFDVTLEMDMTDHTGVANDESLKAIAEDVHFPEMPLVTLAQGEYVAHNVSGRGKSVTYTKEVVSA